MELDPNALRPFKGEQFEGLMRDLLALEAAHAGLPLGLEGISARADGQGDGGVDILVASAPPRPSARIPGHWVFQVKTSLDLSKLKRELKSRSNARVRKLLRDGAGYTLIVNAHLEAEKVLPKLRTLLKDAVHAKVKCAVLPREAVAAWLAEHPQLWSRLPHLTSVGRHLRSFAQWEAQTGAARLPWTPDESRSALTRRIAELTPGSICRVIGLPGVGKTRLVLEALRARAREVCYLPLHVSEVEDLLAHDTPLKGVLVVDECSTDQHERLARLRANHLTLITIGTAEDRTLLQPREVIPLEPLEREAMRALAERVDGWVDSGARLELARVSEGFPKYFDLLLQSVEAASERRLTFESSELRQLTKRFLASVGTGDELSALAAAKWVDLSPGANDLEVLAATVGSSEARLRRGFEALFKRGLAGRRDHLWYVSPRILAEQLAADFWGIDASTRFSALIRNGAEHDLIERCVLRLEDGQPDLQEVFLALARDPEITLEHLTQEQRNRFLRALAIGEPSRALEFVRSTTRRPLVWSAELAEALGRIARDACCFTEAAGLLVESILGEPEARHEALLDLFPSRGALTHASVDDRVRVVEQLVGSPRVDERALGAELVLAGCRRRHSPPPVQAFDTPTPEAEHRYRARMVELLCPLMVDSSEAIRAMIVASVPELVRQQVQHGFESLAVMLVRKLREHGHSVERVQRVYEELTHLQRRGRLSADLSELGALLAARTLKEEFQALFKRRSRAEAERGELRQLLVRWFAQPSEDVLVLLSQVGVGRYQAGELLAEVDPSRSLLPRVEAALIGADRSPHFAEGYLHQSDQYDSILDRWAQDPRLANAVMILTCSQSLDSRRVDRICSVVAHGTLKADWPWFLHGYFAAPVELRARLRGLFEANPEGWLHLVADIADQPQRSALVLDELEAAWAANHESDDPDWKAATFILQEHRPEFLRKQILRTIRDRSHLPDQFVPFAPVFLEPWREFAEVLEGLSHEAQLRVVVELRGCVARADCDAILEWIGSDERRLQLVARLAGPVADEPDNLAASLLESRPSHQGLRQILHSNFKLREGFPGVYDPTTEARRSELEELRGLAKSPRRGVAIWARAVIAEQERIIQEHRANDEADRLGMGWAREPGEKIGQAIYRLAEAQSGYFTAAQAARVGCSAQLLQNYRKTRKVVRVQRSIYRLRQFPPGEHEDLVVVWLWSGGLGVLSHATALTLHGLSSVIAEHHELTLPTRHESRRVRVPPNVKLHFADVPERDRVSIGPLVVTSVERTLADCERAGLGPELLREARADARRRGLLA